VIIIRLYMTNSYDKVSLQLLHMVLVCLFFTLSMVSTFILLSFIFQSIIKLPLDTLKTRVNLSWSRLICQHSKLVTQNQIFLS